MGAPEEHKEMPLSPYLASDDLIAAAQVALELKLPLLLTGEPGTGKTQFAAYVANKLGPEFLLKPGVPTPLSFPLYVFETKSNSVASDLFYRFDNLRRFHAVHDEKMSRNNIDYMTFEALGRAILESLPWDQVADLVPTAENHVGPRRSVVLIDEIDKAPRDFPNDLLNEIDQMYFKIPELSKPGLEVRSVRAPEDLRPIVIMTSNSERNLPAAFLRRCVFHHIRFPDQETDPGRLADIVRSNSIKQSRLSDSAIKFFYDVRAQLELDKQPTTSELIQWIEVLYSRARVFGNIDVAKRTLCALPPTYVSGTLGAIAKTSHDLHEITQFAADWSDEQNG